jgi:hypothetical protein
MTTNTQTSTGQHRTDEPFGVVIKTHPHHRGHCSRLVGQINAQSWADRADSARLDAEFRREYRSRRADLAAALQRTSA